MRIRILTLLMISALLIPGANAALTLYISDGTTNVLVTDNGAGDANGTTGAITYNGPIGGNWTVSVVTGLSKPLTSNPSGDIDLNAVQASSAAGGDLTIILADNGWPGQPGGGVVTLSIGGTLASGATLDAQAWVDNSGGLPTLANPMPVGAVKVADTLNITTSPFAVVASGAINPLTAGFTLIEKTVLHHVGQGNTSYDGEVTIPEPATLTLLGGALLLSGRLLRRKLSRT